MHLYFLDSCLKFYQHRTMRADPKMEIMKNVIQEQRMIQYLSYYGNEKCREKRAYVLAATNKIDYITAAIQACGDRVEIISMSPVRDVQQRRIPMIMAALRFICLRRWIHLSNCGGR